MDGPDKAKKKLGCNINYLGILTFMRHPCFHIRSAKKVLHIFPLSAATKYIHGYFTAERAKMPFLRHF